MARYAIAIAAGAGLLISALLGIVIIPLLRRLHFGQTINEIGPTWHEKKQGTPTFGGILFIVGSILGLLIGYFILQMYLPEYILQGQGQNIRLVTISIVTSLLFALVGFIDDYIKVVKKRNLGLTEWPKIIMQSVITIAFLLVLHFNGRLSTAIVLPGAGYFDLGIFFYPLAFLLIVGMVNAVNLTDGIDGLATSVTICVMIGFIIITNMFTQYELSLWAAALAGACLGFLFWNFYPAKVFMGDTGSMFLGGAVVSIAFCMGTPEILIILGLVYLLEALSVMIQVGYFKATHGKRLFKMTPIHHHFEMSGWSEIKIDIIFSAATLVCVVLTVLYVRYFFS